jgi:predicted ATPase
MHTIVGRDDAVTIVGAELEKRRLLTITGPGGIGKTTVAIATANHHAKRFQGAPSLTCRISLMENEQP